eukprot:g3741.t1
MVEAIPILAEVARCFGDVIYGWDAWGGKECRKSRWSSSCSRKMSATLGGPMGVRLNMGAVDVMEAKEGAVEGLPLQEPKGGAAAGRGEEQLHTIRELFLARVCVAEFLSPGLGYMQGVHEVRETYSYWVAPEVLEFGTSTEEILRDLRRRIEVIGREVGIYESSAPMSNLLQYLTKERRGAGKAKAAGKAKGAGKAKAVAIVPQAHGAGPCGCAAATPSSSTAAACS